MTTLATESRLMRNPALGALLLWRFAKSYGESCPSKEGAPLPLAFLVLPLVWDPITAEAIEGTLQSSGLRKYVGKFAKGGGAQDVLFGISERMLAWRPKTVASLRVSLATGLISINPKARLVSRSTATESGSNRTVKTMTDAADKIGAWFAPLSLHEISLTLQVEF